MQVTAFFFILRTMASQGPGVESLQKASAAQAAYGCGVDKEGACHAEGRRCGSCGCGCSSTGGCGFPVGVGVGFVVQGQGRGRGPPPDFLADPSHCARAAFSNCFVLLLEAAIQGIFLMVIFGACLVGVR